MIVFNDRSLDHKLHVLAFLDLKSRVTYEYLFKILKSCATSISGKSKTSCTANDNIAI